MIVKLNNGMVINPSNVSVVGAADKFGYCVVGLNDGTNLKLKEIDVERLQNAITDSEENPKGDSAIYKNLLVTDTLSTRNIFNSDNITTGNLTITSGKLNVSQIEASSIKIGDNLYIDSDGTVHIKKLVVDDLVWLNGDLGCDCENRPGGSGSGSGSGDKEDPNNPGGDKEDPDNPDNPGDDKEDPDNPNKPTEPEPIIPLTASEALEKYSEITGAWVDDVLIRGKIFGSCNPVSGTIVPELGDSYSIKQNIVISDGSSHIVVELPLGQVGDSLSLFKHPDNLNRYVTVLGRYHRKGDDATVEYKQPTITQVAQCWFDIEEIPSDMYEVYCAEKGSASGFLKVAEYWEDMLYRYEGEDADYDTMIPKETHKDQIIWGYIVGYCNYTGKPEPIFGVPTDPKNRKSIIISNFDWDHWAGVKLDAPDIIYVDLPDPGDIIDDLNLYDHPENLGKVVALVGDCTSTELGKVNYPTITNIKGYWGWRVKFNQSVFNSFLRGEYDDFKSFDPLTGLKYPANNCWNFDSDDAKIKTTYGELETVNTVPFGDLINPRESGTYQGDIVSVNAYIVGFVDGIDYLSTKFGKDNAVDTNIVIAEGSAEDEIPYTVVVRLADSPFQRSLNLKDKPEILWQPITIVGYYDEYMGRYAITDVLGYKLGKSPNIDVRKTNITLSYNRQPEFKEDELCFTYTGKRKLPIKMLCLEDQAWSHGCFLTYVKKLNGRDVIYGIYKPRFTYKVPEEGIEINKYTDVLNVRSWDERYDFEKQCCMSFWLDYNKTTRNIVLNIGVYDYGLKVNKITKDNPVFKQGSLFKLAARTKDKLGYKDIIGEPELYRYSDLSPMSCTDKCFTLKYWDGEDYARVDIYWDPMLNMDGIMVPEGKSKDPDSIIGALCFRFSDGSGRVVTRYLRLCDFAPLASNYDRLIMNKFSYFTSTFDNSYVDVIGVISKYKNKKGYEKYTLSEPRDVDDYEEVAPGLFDIGWDDIWDRDFEEEDGDIFWEGGADFSIDQDYQGDYDNPMDDIDSSSSIRGGDEDEQYTVEFNEREDWDNIYTDPDAWSSFIRECEQEAGLNPDDFDPVDYDGYDPGDMDWLSGGGWDEP